MAGDVRSSEAPTEGGEVTMSFEPPETKPEPEKVEYDEFGLPIRKARRYYDDDDEDEDEDEGADEDANQNPQKKDPVATATPAKFKEEEPVAEKGNGTIAKIDNKVLEKDDEPVVKKEVGSAVQQDNEPVANKDDESVVKKDEPVAKEETTNRNSIISLTEEARRKNEVKMFSEDPADPRMLTGAGAVSEWSHQQIVPQKVPEDEKHDSEDEWQAMPAYASYDMFDDEGRLIAKQHDGSDDEGNMGMPKGYTRVNVDEDAQSATSMDENTGYLFKETEDDEASRNPLSQMQATKDLLTEGQRIAYVGVCRLAMQQMVADLESLTGNSGSRKKAIQTAVESAKMWSQKMMVRLYTHMEVSAPEQVMIEQLAEHGVVAADLTPALMKNSRVNNPMAASPSESVAPDSPRPSVYPESPRPSSMYKDSRASLASSVDPPPPYEVNAGEELPDVKMPSELPESKTIDIDLRWTVLCDLFLVLIADSVYDSRSRTLLEHVGQMLEVPWLEICKFEKRVTDALEMQESTEQNWNDKDHLEAREKKARNKRYMMLGLATVGGGLVIGLSGGLLAPVIGAGLAAGFTTIGVAGTSGFLAGAGGTALIASGSAVSGAFIGGKAGFNRAKAVKTFEFRPLHNAKRVNLVITVAGWMNGKVDDVRLPFSTVDPIMGDVCSLHWEPEMLQSMGQTINILATEVLTQSLQQVLGSTILIGLMASLQLPIVLTKLSYLVDNPWSVSLDRATAAGLIMADTLMHRNLGVRPVTLVGYSLGARVIYSCLRELARNHAYGLVQNVYMFGSPIVVKKDEYAQAVSVVPGRWVNGYASNDWILGYLFRATSGGLGRVAGLHAIQDIPGIENVDVTTEVAGHMAYRAAIPKLMRKMGWEVMSDEFAEIEDPDPDNHTERQRELIDEIEEARRELEKKPAKKKFSFFGLGKDKTKKKEWETYDEIKKTAQDSQKDGPAATDANGGKKSSDDGNVLFDVDAIRAEVKNGIHEEDLRMRELESTMPALKVGSSKEANNPYGNLRATKSYEDAPALNGTHPGSRSASGFSGLPEYSGSGYGRYGHDGDHDDGELQMSFEPEPSPAYSKHSPTYGTPSGNTKTEENGRPPLRSSYTTPASVANERNVWLDDEDEFESKGDGEMTMTFA